MTGLEERLGNLRLEAAGDWDDVVARVRQGERRRSPRRLVLVVAALALVIGVGTALAIGHVVFDWFAVTKTHEEVPGRVPDDVPYVAGRVLHLPGRPAQQLRFSLLAPLLGQDAHLVVPSPDGRLVVYHSWRHNVALLVVHDIRTGRDRILARGAQTVAWAPDGRIAYLQAIRPRFGRGNAYRGRIVVRRPFDGPPVVWTRRPAAYGVIAWAGGRLLVGVRRCLLLACNPDPETGVYALDRPGKLVRLPISSVSALSPDGRLAVGAFLPVPGQDSPSSLVRLVDVIQGRVLTTLDLAAAARAVGRNPGAFDTGIQAAAWRGDEIVATSTGGVGSKLVFLRVSRGRLAFVDVLRIPRATLPVRYGPFFGAPAFTGRGTARVTVFVRGDRGDNTGSAAVITCDRRSRSCVRGRLLPERKWFSVLGNQSRPLP
jgi:hypothetical protein